MFDRNSGVRRWARLAIRLLALQKQRRQNHMIRHHDHPRPVHRDVARRANTMEIETATMRYFRRAARRARDDERGVSLIIVAIQILVLTAMCTFVLDYGMVWLGRRQAQNAADAGALAAAQALAKDDGNWPGIAPVVTASGNGVAQTNKVIGATPGSVVTPVCPPWMTAPNNINCVQVDVYRDGTNGSTTMPVFFGRVLGISSQSVKATATAQVMAANTSGCLRPWFVRDRYIDVDLNMAFNSPPDIFNASTGYKLPDDIGTSVSFGDDTAPSSYGHLNVGMGAAGAAFAIRWCDPEAKFSLDDTLATEPGASVGPEVMAISDVISWDPDSGACGSWLDGCVHWDAAKKKIVGGCSAAGNCMCTSGVNTNPCPYNGTQSPRIVQVALCSPTEGDCGGAPGAGEITTTNILSFFITGCNGVLGSCAMAGGGGAGGGGGGGRGGGGVPASTLVINAIIIGSGGELEAGTVPAPGKSFITVQMLVR
jgi:Flp pilus assembly protein TadG